MAILFTPGQVVAQPDWAALVQQHGGDKPAQKRTPTTEETAAARKAAREAAPIGENEEPDPNDPRTHYIKYETNPIYRSYMEDGSYVEWRTAPNGTDYQIVSYTPSQKFTQAETKRAAADPAQQTPAQQNETILNQQRAKNAALPGPNPQGATEEERRGQDPRYETDQERATRADTTIKAQGAAADVTRKEAEATAEKNKPQVVPGTLNTTSPNIGVVGADGQTVTWIPNKNFQNPTPQPISIPGNPKTIYWDDGPGKPVRAEKNPDYVKPSKIMPHPSDPTKMVNVTEDDNGNPVILPVDDKTTIKPADLPVLQAKYGQIAQGLGALAQDLNSRYARGEITEKQKNDAFTAAHQQASTQVAEINSILETSKSIWSGELTQRGQSLQETQSRRGFAQNIFDRSAATGMGIATSAGPGHGREIAAGVGALMNIGQQYAQGMGGFKESPEIPLPAALQQARGISLPGYGAPGTPPAGAAIPPTGPLPSGISNTTDAGGGPRVMTPASATRPGAPIPPPGGATPPVPLPGMAQPPGAPPPVPLPTTAPAPGFGDPGFTRDLPPIPGMPTPVPLPGMPASLQGMGQLLQGAQGFSGSPVAAGGAGLWDPTNDVAQMLGDGADPDWAEAVRAAAAAAAQPGYAWQRFGQPASRFG